MGESVSFISHSVYIRIGIIFHADAANKFLNDIVEFVARFIRRLQRDWRPKAADVLRLLRVDARQHKKILIAAVVILALLYERVTRINELQKNIPRVRRLAGRQSTLNGAHKTPQHQ